MDLATDGERYAKKREILIVEIEKDSARLAKTDDAEEQAKIESIIKRKKRRVTEMNDAFPTLGLDCWWWLEVFIVLRNILYGENVILL